VRQEHVSFGKVHLVRYILSMATRPVILSIAGYDPSSGAGVTADVKTAAALGCYAVTCITALTVQSTQGVFEVEAVRPELVRETLYRLAEDVEIAAVRIGMLGTGEIAEVVADFLRQNRCKNVVLDPILRSSSGTALVDRGGVEAIRTQLLPLASIVTPNLLESLELVGADAAAVTSAKTWESALPLVRQAARKLHKMGAQAVVITGGDLQEANDYVSIGEDDSITEQVLAARRIESCGTHGTGCAFATAIACRLARGSQLIDAARDAKEYVRQAMAAAYPVGKGVGPVNHHYRVGE
jgi:hydroxymethylpyrimidine/phosphomethylpyrimidine kinase